MSKPIAIVTVRVYPNSERPGRVVAEIETDGPADLGDRQVLKVLEDAASAIRSRLERESDPEK